MPTYQSFEDLPVWRGAKDLAVLIYRTIAKTKVYNDFGLKDQMQRAVLSISNNIAEGFERGTKKEFIYFLYIACGSCGELRSQLHVTHEIGYFKSSDFHLLHERSKNLSKQIHGFIEYLKTNLVNSRA